MGKGSHTRGFSATEHESIVRRVVEDHRAVNEEAQAYWRANRQLKPVVDVKNGRTRLSRNAMKQRDDGLFELTLGPAVGLVAKLDATGSFAQYYTRTYVGIGDIHGMLAFYKEYCNPQLMSAIVQDVRDETPVVQAGEFETDNRITEQMEALMPANAGGDSTEDYDLVYLFMLHQIEMDINRYGLKGYSFLTADEVGRGEITPETAYRHLGIDLQATVETADVLRRLHEKFHMFYLQVNDDNATTRWWNTRFGRKGHVVHLPSAELGAAMQVGLIYLCENLNVDKRSFVDFLVSAAGATNNPITRPQAEVVWNEIDRAQVEMGAQAKLPNFSKLPKPGSLFVDLRDPWPQGHEYFHLNPSQTGKPAGPAPASTSPSSSTDAGSDTIDWSSF